MCRNVRSGLTYYFNPRSPCGERLFAAQAVDICDDISIHAPRAGSDQSSIEMCIKRHNFNPRSPCGERPWSTNSPAALA